MNEVYVYWKVKLCFNCVVLIGMCGIFTNCQHCVNASIMLHFYCSNFVIFIQYIDS